MTVIAPVLIGVVYVLLSSLIREPYRLKVNAVMVAGAGAAYLSGGGLGGWEFAFTIVATYCAYRGLQSWTFVGIAWLLHTAWDAVHHLYGNPIVPFAEHSSLGCAICDPVIAIWCFAGGPSLIDLLRTRFSRRTPPTKDLAPPR
ncbi:DUF6010 family protein [Streptoalloteichus hindustanus]|uniref:Integral membrane protein n=1 Tax=Streptoalloteichus hindustanus TaxID=2017 RepID=A0A1M5D493_STRHI|nr:DUF6010 family protein [Streptoalloteichus hindustanus]SHF61903.1 hypothetical protein SAMN05444320_104297 [Streptoalloteichus hindustanus]